MRTRLSMYAIIALSMMARDATGTLVTVAVAHNQAILAGVFDMLCDAGGVFSLGETAIMVADARGWRAKLLPITVLMASSFVATTGGVLLGQALGIARG